MRYLPLLLILSTAALATPTADDARKHSIDRRNAIAVHDAIILQGKVDEAIDEAIKAGSFDTNVVTTFCAQEAIHVVNQRLRKLGYKCEVVINSWNGDQLDVISWDPK